MSKQVFLVILAVALLGGAGFLVITATHSKPPPAPSQLAAQLAKTQPSSTPAAVSEGKTDDAKVTVTKFVLALDSPGKQDASAADKQAALDLLTPTVQARVKQQYGNDPAKLLTAPRPSSFVVGEPSGSPQIALTVTFKYKDGRPSQTIGFNLQQNQGKWLISGVQVQQSNQR